jgi:uncharacterized SAM-binding protein YcdF (DUF218 family)
MEREKYASAIAFNSSSLIFISSGGRIESLKKIFSEVDPKRIFVDYEAVDTVTNFTTTLPKLKQHNIDSVYIVTSDFHTRRAMAIACIILGFHKIKFCFISLPSDKKESFGKTVRDVFRSLLWLATGYTGAEIFEKELRVRQSL